MSLLESKLLSLIYIYIYKYIANIYVCMYIYKAFTDSTPPRTDTEVFKSFGRFIIVLLD